MATEIINATVECGYIIDEDRGLSAGLQTNHCYGHQAFGSYGFEGPVSRAKMGTFIKRCLKICECTDWSKLKGKPIRVKLEGGLIKAIGHFIKDEWFVPADEMAD